MKRFLYGILGIFLWLCMCAIFDFYVTPQNINTHMLCMAIMCAGAMAGGN